MQPQQSPAAASNRNNTRRRRRPGLSLPRLSIPFPLPKRDTSLAVPLPPGSAPASSSSSSSTQLSSITSQVNFSDLDRINRIGSGSGSTVYKVLHRPSGKLYALKVILGDHEDSVRREICREIEILRDVDNPSVVKCHDMFDHNGEIQILLEYMDGGSLEGSLIHDEPSLSDFSRQILSGLYYLHRHRIVHRNIKPSNLLINSRKQVKIADFGVSRILSQTMDPCSSSVGTIGYMSPERINTDTYHGMYDGYAGDIWSLGVSILEFYLGRCPFAIGGQVDWASLMGAICLSQPPKAPPTASSEFRDFIACCLQRDPAKRWTALQLLSHPFIVQNAGANNQNNQGAGGTMAKPIPSFRKNAMAMVATNLTKKSDDDRKSGSGCLFVKISMDGAPYLRKVDLKTYSNYIELSSAIEKMFSCFTIGPCGSHGLSESHLKDLLLGSEHVLTYEDKDGNWMLVGDVPWEIFIDSCNSMRIIKGSEAIGLGFRTLDKQNLSAPGPKSRGEEDSERLQVQLHQYSDAITSMSDRQITSDTAQEGGVLFMGELVRMNEIGEVVTKRRKLSPEDEGSLTRETDEVSHSSEEELIWLDELEETPSDPRVVKELNCDPMEVCPIISPHFSILHVLDLSYTEINSLPQSISRLVALRKLFLRGCDLLMELPPEIGELVNLEVLDLEGTEILCLPKEIAKLVNLTCLKVSFYGCANQRVIPRRVLSNLSRLKELIIDVTPYGEWWDVEAETIIDDMCSLKELTTLKLSLPTAELLRNLAIFRRLANFRFTVGRHGEHFVSRLPHDVEEEFNNQEKLDKGLKYINGSHVPNEVTEVFRHANAFFLQRHWTAKSLSEFGHENMNEVKYCLVMECNEFRTFIDFQQFYLGKDGRSESKDFQDFDEAIVLGSLEKLIICYMKNMESVWKGPVGKGSLSNLKSLALHTCPNLTTLFTIDVFGNLLNLEELIVEDCPKIDSLVSLKSSDSKAGLFLPSLKKISLLELPKLVSISSGLCIAPNLERMVIFYCPKLKKLSTMDVSSTKLKVIKGEKEWWDALKWYESDLSTEHKDYLARLFIPLRRDGDLMAQLTKD